MLLKRWEPFTELSRMEAEMDRTRRHTFRPLYMWPRSWDGDGRIAIDVYREADSLVVRAAIPGVKPEEVDVAVDRNTLVIKGESKVEEGVKEKEYLHRERRYGTFQRTVALPEGLDAEKADASYDNGVLTVSIPKSEESKPHSLKINVKSPEGQKS